MRASRYFVIGNNEVYACFLSFSPRENCEEREERQKGEKECKLKYHLNTSIFTHYFWCRLSNLLILMCFIQFFEDLATDGKVEENEPTVKETQGKQVMLWGLSTINWESRPLDPSLKALTHRPKTISLRSVSVVLVVEV